MSTDKKPLPVYVTPKQRKWIEKESKNKGISLSQAVLQLVNKEMEK